MKEDISLSTLKKVIVGGLVIIAILQASVWYLYRYVRSEDQQRDVRRTFVDSGPPIPPDPRLQVDPQRDFQEYFRKQQETLNSYGWASRPEGRARMPVERAMELMVQRAGGKR
jgi:hypothetical protein